MVAGKCVGISQRGIRLFERFVNHDDFMVFPIGSPNTRLQISHLELLVIGLKSRHLARWSA